jgi:hypothetical protein
VREALMDKRTFTIYPLSRWIAGGGGIKVCAVSNFIYTGRGGGFGFFNEKGSKGKKVLLQDM